MRNKKIIQNSKVKIQNCKSKVKSSFALLFNFIRRPADKIIPVAVIPELNSGQALMNPPTGGQVKS